jgi:hypothetical protein
VRKGPRSTERENVSDGLPEPACGYPKNIKTAAAAARKKGTIAKLEVG